MTCGGTLRRLVTDEDDRSVSPPTSTVLIMAMDSTAGLQGLDQHLNEHNMWGAAHHLRASLEQGDTPLLIPPFRWELVLLQCGVEPHQRSQLLWHSLQFIFVVLHSL